jgi:hypothetical protein
MVFYFSGFSLVGIGLVKGTSAQCLKNSSNQRKKGSEPPLPFSWHTTASPSKAAAASPGGIHPLGNPEQPVQSDEVTTS